MERELRTTGRLAEPEAASVLDLVEAALEIDGAPALNDEARLKLGRTGPGVRHLRIFTGPGSIAATLIAYAQLDESAPGEHALGSVVVAPKARRQGLGGRLVAQLTDLATRPLQLWAVGNSPAAQALAARAGLVAARSLLIMRRPLPGAGLATIGAPPRG